MGVMGNPSNTNSNYRKRTPSSGGGGGGEEDLHTAARTGDIHAVQSIIASNPLTVNSRDKHSRTPTKHAGVDAHSVREIYDNGFLRVKHIPSEDQLADIITKGLCYPTFSRLLSKVLTAKDDAFDKHLTSTGVVT